MLSNHAANVIEHEIHLAEIDDTPAGVLELNIEEDCLFIENLAVHPNLQGSGIALELLKFAENRCREARMPMLRLLTNQKFETNIAFYLKRGFCHEYDSEYKGGIAVHMVKRIT